MRKGLVAILSLLMLFSALSPARAGQLSALGVTVTWDEASLFAPEHNGPCVNNYLQYSDPTNQFANISVQNQYGATLGLVSPIIGGTGQVRLMLCDSNFDFTGLKMVLDVITLKGEQVVSSPISLAHSPTPVATPTPVSTPTPTPVSTPTPTPVSTPTSTPVNNAPISTLPTPSAHFSVSSLSGLLCYADAFSAEGITTYKIKGTRWTISKQPPNDSVATVIDTFDFPFVSENEIPYTKLRSQGKQMVVKANGLNAYAYVPLDQRVGTTYTCQIAILTDAGVSNYSTIKAIATFETNGYVAVSNPTPTATPTPTKQASKRTIVCIKGKLTKKVTGTNPKCPAGYKIKG